MKDFYQRVLDGVEAIPDAKASGVAAALGRTEGLYTSKGTLNPAGRTASFHTRHQ